jgi:HlyD family secretion protein
LIILLLAGSLSACAPEVEAQEVNEPTVIEDIQFEEEISASGEVVPVTWVNLFYPNGATDLEFLVDVGETVKKGDVLVTSNSVNLEAVLVQAEAALAQAKLAYEDLTSPPSEAALAAAEAALMSAESALETQKYYYARDDELDAAQAQIDAARANLDALNEGASDEQIAAAELNVSTAEIALEQAKAAFDLVAPFSGTIVEINAKDGGAIGAGQPLIVLADLEDLQIVTTDLSEIDITKLQVGMVAEILFDALPNQTFLGTITSISEKSTGTSSVYFNVYLKLDEIPAGLRWGMTAYINFSFK